MKRLQLYVFGTMLLFFSGASAFRMELEIDPSDEDALPSAIFKAVNDAYEMNMKGLEALEKKQYDVALDYFDEALKILPDYDDARNNRGVVYYRKGVISEAEKIWEKLASEKPEYSTASYNLGLILLHEKQADAAARLFERAIRSNSKFTEAYVRLGLIYLQTGKKEKGLENLRKAYKIEPNNQDAWSFLAHGLIVTGDTAGAVAVLKKHEGKAEALRMLGLIESSRKNYEKAATLLSKAVSAGADPNILVELASAQVERGKCKEALTSLNRYFQSPVKHSADAFLMAGIASKDCGDVKGARKYFEEGSEKYPDDAIIKYNLGQIYFNLKKYEQAENTWTGLSDSLQDPSLLYIRALNARRMGNLSVAQKLITRALEMDDRAEYHDLLGVIYHQNKDDKKAEEAFRKALRIDPQLRSAQLNLALLSRKGEDLGAAARQIENQLSNCSGDSCADLSFQLSIIYYHQKLFSKAAQIISKVKEEDKDERIYRHLAIYYRENQEYDKAIAALETAAKRLVLEPQTEYELAETCLMAGYYKKASGYYLALIPKWKQNPWRLYYQLGYSFMEAYELDKAEEYFKKSIKSKENVGARGLLAFVYNRKGNSAEARKLWEKNLKDDPSNPVLWINMGLSLEKEGRYEEALEHYKKAVILKKDDKELQINIGNALAGLERYTDAVGAYSLALSSSKRELAAYNLFLIARKKKERERASKMIDILKKEYPSSVYTMRAEAEMSLWDGDTAKAMSKLESIKERDESDWLSMASVYAARGDRQKTENCLKNVPDEKAFRKEVDAVKAQLAFKLGDYGEALRILKQAGDTSFAARYNIALTAFNAGQFGEALNIVESLANSASGKDRADCCRLAGNAAFALKQWKKARTFYLQLSNVEAQNSIVQYNLAVASYNLGEMKDAWKYYQRARELDASIYNKDIERRYNQENSKKDTVLVMDSLDIWYNEAVKLQSDGAVKEAEALYEKILKKDPSHNLTWNNLGAIYGARGDIDNAEKAYMKAIERKHDIPETYANLITLYIELEEFGKARQWLIKGLGHNPESELLEGFREKIAERERMVKAQKRSQ